MTLRVLENFAGIGTQRMALENLGITHEVVGITEIDKFAIKSYEAIHGAVNNLGDISKVDPNDVPDHDLFIYSYPCQDISTSGKLKGFERGSGTRSGLLWECEKVIRAKKPKYLLMENVKNLVSKKFKAGYEDWLQTLEELGYTNYWKVLNSKDFGIPQNRERVFCVSILGEHEPYEFPEPTELEFKVADILEENVPEKFYLDSDRARKLTSTVTDRDSIKWVTKNNVPSGKSFAIGASRGRNPENTSDRTVGIPTEQRLEINKHGISNTITTVQKDNYVVENTGEGVSFAIRKLTPKECWRLMGISDDDFDKAQEVNSDTQLYKQAGNAIVVNVLEALFESMFK